MNEFEEYRKRWFDLARRFNEVALLLPRPEDFDSTDPDCDVPGAKLVIAELKRIQAEMDAIGREVRIKFPERY